MGKRARSLSLTDAVTEYVEPGCELAIGGLHFHNTPMAMIREIIRRRIPIARLVPPVDGSLNADQLIGAGLVDEVHTPYVGLEHLGMAPRFRAAVEAGEVRVRECEEGGFVLGLIAGASGQPFAALPEGFLPEPGQVPTVASVNRDDYRTIEDPFTGRVHTVARAIRPDVALIHCQLIDARGNCGFLGGPFLDVEIAKAAGRCVVLAERQVEDLPGDCQAYLPGFVVDAYCVLEHGVHPASSQGLYRQDDEELRRYVEVARTADGFATYVRDVIGDSEAAYREAADVARRCAALGSGAMA